MSDKSKRRRLLDEIGSSPAFLPEGSRFTGDFETPGALVLCGSIRGDGHVGGALRMAVSSSWQGEVHAQHGIVAGRIKERFGRPAIVIAEKSPTCSAPLVESSPKR